MLRFYLHEDERHGGKPAWEWLLDQANELGIRGGSAFKAIAGFGHQHHISERRPLDLSGSQVTEVEFVVGAEEATRLLELVQTAGLRVFYACMPASLGGLATPDLAQHAAPR
jgi:PII-like signaling protein